MSFLFAQVMLLSWVPIVLILFLTIRPRDAAIASYITALLLLPQISFALSGLPDLDKTSATVYASILAVLIFDIQRVVSIRLAWYDIPVFGYCIVCPIISSFSNNLGGYEAASAVLAQFIFWGFPYLVGRLYLSDLEGMKRFCLGVAIGGLIYAPLCLIEIRLSPLINGWVYGIGTFEGLRYGGFRPRVFLRNGLELGIWMTGATLMAWNLSNSGAVKRLWGFPFKFLTIFLTVVTVLCKATGALVLLAFGLTVLWIVRKTKRFWLIWLVLAVAPTYYVTRTSGLWTGSEAVQLAKDTVGDERAQSLEYRFYCEEILFDFVWKRPIFGYGRYGGFNESSKGEMKSIIDGYWIIVLGNYGFAGLTLFTLIHMMPIVLMMRRFPAKTWNDPEIAPAVALVFMLSLFTIENLSNAMPNQLYALVMGGGMALTSTRLVGKSRATGAEAELARAIGLANDGHDWEAEAEFRRVISHCSGRHSGPEATAIRAAAFEGLGEVLRKSGRIVEAEAAFREALFDRLNLVSGSPDPVKLGELALSHEALARVLADLGHVGQAIEERRRAMEIWEDPSMEGHDDLDLPTLRADALNDLAWLLTSGGDPSFHDPARAARLAAEAVRRAPDRVAFWNTLGVARYRAGDWAGAVEALEHSVEIGPPGGTAFDLFFLAMAYCRLGQIDRAKECRDRALKWTDRHRPDHHGLASFRREVGAMLDESV